MKQRTSVVLGGGGLAGIGWLIGVLAAFEETSALTLTTADEVIGTSAGSAVGAAVLQSGSATSQFDAMVRKSRRNAELAPTADLIAVSAEIIAIITDDVPVTEKTIRLAALSRERSGVDPAARRKAVAGRLTSEQWPTNLVVTALGVDGGLRTFTGTSGVALTDAVTASCAAPGIWPTATIDGLDYIDGGSFSATNAHLAADAERVIVLAPMPDLGGEPAPEVASVLDRAIVVRPSERATAHFGPDPFDPDIRGIAAVLGYEDGLVTATTEIL